jgi:DNA-directed RNA polymerase specialized sigma24 family protein
MQDLSKKRSARATVPARAVHVGVKERLMVTRGRDLELGAAMDEQADWAQVVRSYAPYVHAVAVRAYGLGEVEAEEVFQEVFLRTYLRLGQLDGDEARRAWVTSLTREVAAARSRGVAPSADLLGRLDGALRREQRRMRP